MAPGLDQIDWQVPWLAPVAALGQQVLAHCQAGLLLPQALNACAPPAGDGPVRFVPQSALPDGEAYESYIFNSKQCPTREGLHDFFNGLMWHNFPRTKTRLNQLQAARSQAGQWLNRADQIQATQEGRAVQLQADKSRAEDLDMVKGISDFTRIQTGYQAALQSYAQVQKLSLFNFIS